MTGPERTQMWALLRKGYGVEDVGVRLRKDPDEMRRLIRYHRARNTLHGILGTDRRRNAEALKIMGVAAGQ